MSVASTVVSAWSSFIVYIAKTSLKTSHLKGLGGKELILRTVQQVSYSQVMAVYNSLLCLPENSTVASLGCLRL